MNRGNTNNSMRSRWDRLCDGFVFWALMSAAIFVGILLIGYGVSVFIRMYAFLASISVIFAVLACSFIILSAVLFGVSLTVACKR